MSVIPFVNFSKLAESKYKQRAVSVKVKCSFPDDYRENPANKFSILIDIRERS